MPKKHHRGTKSAHLTNIKTEYDAWHNIDYVNDEIDPSVIARVGGEKHEAADARHLIEMGITHAAELAREFYYDPHMMKMVRNRILYELDITKGDDAALTSQLIVGSRSIGAESENGVVYKAGFYNDDAYERYIKALTRAINTRGNTRVAYPIDDNGIFAVKTDLTGNINNVYHEYLVGLEVNNLRVHHCPYFAYTYCVEECSAPVFGKTNLISSCVSGKGTGYMVMEAIEGAMPLADYCLTADYDQFVIVMALLINALYIAWMELNFTHGDLHGFNVLIRKIGNSGSAPYTLTDGSVIYLDTDEVPAVIDLGTASTARNPWTSFEVSPNSTPVHDLIRLLGYISEPDVEKYAKDVRNVAFARTVLAYCMKGLTRGDSEQFDLRISPETKVHREIGEVMDFVEETYKILDLPRARTPGKPNLSKKYTLTQNRHFALDEILADRSLAKYKAATIEREKHILTEIGTAISLVLTKFNSTYKAWTDKKAIGLGFEVVELGAIINRLYTDMNVKVDLMNQLGTVAKVKGIRVGDVELVRKRVGQVYDSVKRKLDNDEDARDAYIQHKLASKAWSVSQRD